MQLFCIGLFSLSKWCITIQLSTTQQGAQMGKFFVVVTPVAGLALMADMLLRGVDSYYATFFLFMMVG